MNKSAKEERTGTAVAAADKRVILSMGGKGGVGKTSVMTGLAEWFVENEIPVTLLDLDTENKARGSLAHFFGEQSPKVNIHTPAGLDAFVDRLADGAPVILADMGAGAGQVTYDWFERMYPDVREAGIGFTAIGVVTADPASVESVVAWAARLQNRVQYLIVENSVAEQADFTYWHESEQAQQFQKIFEPAVIHMDYRLPDLENASRNHGVTLGQIAGRTTNAPELQKASFVMRAQSYRRRMFAEFNRVRPEQKRVVEFVLDSRDHVVAISGAAGTGKTATLQELRRGLLEARREVLAVAPTMSAVEELQKVGFTDAMTLERLLQDRTAQQALRQKVLILDEAGMVSGRQMTEFLRLADERDARVVFSGDTRQIQSVEACDALRILEKESRLKSIALTQVQRQTQLDYRDAIQELRRDPERGFEKLDAMGAVREVAHADRAQEVARQYSAALETRASVLVVCATHNEIERVTLAIRVDRMRGGRLADGAQLNRDVPLNWTTAQKSDPRNFSVGQVLGFNRAVKGITKNETLEVVRVADKRVVVRNAAGEERTLTAKQAKSFDVYEQRSIEVATGDRLLLTANRREDGFRATNGEIVTVAGVDRTGRICLEDGRTLPAGFRQFTHGYAVTAHRSQGKSVDAVIISGDGMRKELFYVAASRGRQSVQVVTSDKESLRESVAQSSVRKSASELARKVGTIFVRGACRGIMAARHLAMRLSVRETESVPAEINYQYEPRQNEPRKERHRERGFGR